MMFFVWLFYFAGQAVHRLLQGQQGGQEFAERD